MNPQATAVRESPVAAESSASITAHMVHPFYWSVRREVWENRSIYLAPMIVAMVGLTGFLVRVSGLPERRRAALLLDPAHQRTAIEMPYDVLAIMIMLTALIVGVFYSLDALHGERRDRSILFWKSLPVSDLTTVLSKATLPLIIVPLLSFLIIVVTQAIMLLVSSAVLVVGGVSPASTWTNFPFLQRSLFLLYGLVAITLWHAPIYGWLLLVSGWVRRATFLWAVLPMIAIGALEKIALNTTHFATMLRQRLMGWAPAAFDFNISGKVTLDSLVQITPAEYLSTPGLWIGLTFAVVFIAAAIRLRRYRGPL